MLFLVSALIAKISTMTLVKVVAVSNTGAVAAVGTVNVQPLVNQVDGNNVGVSHGVLYNLPYLRIQGGANAVIMDPQVGDIGIAGFADHDISTVASTKAQGNPGSARQFDMADGLYLGGVLNGVPNQYVQFNSTGITIADKNSNTVAMSSTGIILTGPGGHTITMNSSGISINGNLSVTGTVVATANVTAGAIDLETHVHTGVTTGSGSTGAPVG